MSTPALSMPLPRRLRIVDIATDWFGGMQDGLRISRCYRELAAMSDAELARRGLTRQDIPQAAVRSVD